MRTFCSAVNQRLQALRILLIHHVHQGRIDPPSGGDGVKTSDDDSKLRVECLVVVLDLPMVARNERRLPLHLRGDFHTRDPLHHELGRDFSLRSSDVGFATVSRY